MDLTGKNGLFVRDNINVNQNIDTRHKLELPWTSDLSAFWNGKIIFVYWKFSGMYIVENVSTRAEEQPLCKPYSRWSELFRTNHFWRFDKVSDEIKPHNKKQEILQQSLRVLTFFCRKPFLSQFLQSPGKCSVREQSNFTNLVIQG